MAWSGCRETAEEKGLELSLALSGSFFKQQPLGPADAGKGRQHVWTDWLSALDDDEVLKFVNEWYDFLDEHAKQQNGDGYRGPDDRDDVDEDEDLSGPRHCKALPSVEVQTDEYAACAHGGAVRVNQSRARADEYAARAHGCAVRVSQSSVRADGCAARIDISSVHADGTGEIGNDVDKMPVDSDAETYDGEIDDHNDSVLFVPDSLADEEPAEKNGDEAIDEMLKLLIPSLRSSTRSN